VKLVDSDPTCLYPTWPALKTQPVIQVAGSVWVRVRTRPDPTRKASHEPPSRCWRQRLTH